MSSMLSILARELTPREILAPSEFGRRYVSLPSSISASTTFDPDFKPWTRDILDLCRREPRKRGLIGLKRSQIGMSIAAMVMMAAEMDGLGGPMLYVTTDADKARRFAESYVDPIIEGCPRLVRSRLTAAKDLGQSDRMLSKPFVAGLLDLCGAGSESGVISVARRVVVLDEYEQSAANFAKATKSDLFQVAIERMAQYPHTSRFWCFGHPRFEGSDIDMLYRSISDQRPWTYDCPLCRAPIAPKWKNVQFTRKGADGLDDPSSAELVCPVCAGVIHDAARRSAVRRPDGRRGGGSGRFESELAPEVARERPYIGVAVHGLADPDVSLAELAGKWVLCASPAQRFDFLNKVCGEAVNVGRQVLRPEDIRAMLDPAAPAVAPPGTIMVVTGADVQAPRENPTCYCVTVALSRTHAWILDARTVSGLIAWVEYSRRRGIIATGHAGTLPIMAAAIDTGYEGGQVLDLCRERSLWYSQAVAGRYVSPAPMKFVAHLNADNPAVRPPAHKLLKPGSEHLGELAHYHWLHRHSWVDRVMRMMIEGRVSVLGQQPPDLPAHLGSQYLAPVENIHGLAPDREEWRCVKGVPDHYLMALTYAVAGAVLVHKLDQIAAWPDVAVRAWMNGPESDDARGLAKLNDRLTAARRRRGDDMGRVDWGRR